MRLFTVLILAFICSACKPKLIDVADFPIDYQLAEIEWTDANILVYQNHQIDTISPSFSLPKATLDSQLRRQPSYHIKLIRILDKAQVVLKIEGETAPDTLRYEEIAGHFHLWVPAYSEEGFYFRVEPREAALYLPFFFYWKASANQKKNKVYYRTQEDLEFNVMEMLSQHLAYDNFLNNGDTLEIISGSMVYKPK